jgi:hypothetical protein
VGGWAALLADLVDASAVAGTEDAPWPTRARRIFFSSAARLAVPALWFADELAKSFSLFASL